MTALVFTNKLTKLIIVVPTTVNIDGAGCAQLFFEHVFRHHGLPKVIVSDRDPRFTGQFWKTLFALTGTRLNMSTSNHPQTDGQTERVNRVIEEMLRAYVAPHQDDWDEHLVAVEFAYNSSVHASTGETPFFLNYGQHPVTPLAQASTIPHSTIPANENAADFLKRLNSNMERAKDLMKKAQETQAAYANKHRQDHKFQVGDKVMLRTSHFDNIPEVANAKRKRGPRAYGPYTITEVVTPVAMRLNLPVPMRVHPVIHVSQMREYKTSEAFPERVEPEPPAPISLEGQEYYAIEALRNHRFVRGQLQFLVKWEGYTEEHDEWRPHVDLQQDMKTVVLKQLIETYRMERNLPKDFMTPPPPRRSAMKKKTSDDLDVLRAPYENRDRSDCLRSNRDLTQI